MSVTVRITQKFSGKSAQLVDQDFASLAAAVKFAGDYMTITPAAHASLEWIRFELPPQSPHEPAAPRRQRPRKSVRRR